MDNSPTLYQRLAELGETVRNAQPHDAETLRECLMMLIVAVTEMRAAEEPMNAEDQIRRRVDEAIISWLDAEQQPAGAGILSELDLRPAALRYLPSEWTKPNG